MISFEIVLTQRSKMRQSIKESKQSVNKIKSKALKVRELLSNILNITQCKDKTTKVYLCS